MARSATAGTIRINGYVLGFSGQLEPVLPAKIITIPIEPAPSAPDAFTAELNVIYREVLARNPDPSGISTYTGALEDGTSATEIRDTVAHSLESQQNLNGLYHQVFDREIDPSGFTTYQNALGDGSTLNQVQVVIAHSPEARSDLNQIYQEVLGRDADPGGLTTYQDGLGSGVSLDEIRSVIAHSPEGQSHLTQLFQGIVGRAPGAAELIGMEDQLATPDTAQETLISDLFSSGSAGGYMLIIPDIGSTALTGLPETPSMFTFDDIAFGNDMIAGFDPTRDSIQLSHAQAQSFADLQSKMTSVGDGTLITFDSAQSIQIDGVAPSTLGPKNFVIV